MSDPALSDSQTAPGADIHVVAYGIGVVNEDVVVVVGVGGARRGGGGWDELFVLVRGGVLDKHVQVLFEIVELVVVGIGVELAQSRILI